MARNRFVRPALAFCCSLALLLYLVAPVFAQSTQAPAPKSGTTQGMQQNPGTTGTSTPSTTTVHKRQTIKKKTTKNPQGTANARQKPGSSSTGTYPGSKSTNPGTTSGTKQQGPTKSNLSGQKNGSANDTNSGNPPR